MISFEKHFIPQFSMCEAEPNSTEMRASASGLCWRAALQVFALQEPKFSFNVLHTDL